TCASSCCWRGKHCCPPAGPCRSARKCATFRISFWMGRPRPPGKVARIAWGRRFVNRRLSPPAMQPMGKPLVTPPHPIHLEDLNMVRTLLLIVALVLIIGIVLVATGVVHLN